MSTPSGPAFVDEIAALVGTVPGVMAIYTAQPVVAQTVKATVSALIGEPATAQRIHVADTPEGVDVSLHIGVAATDAAADVCRSVYDAVEANLTAAGQEIMRISIKVGRIG